MTTDTQPHVLFVDDDTGVSPGSLSTLLEPHDVTTRLRHPEEVVVSDLRWADLVVVDYFLTHWPERNDSPSAARAPMDGLAVAATLRSRLLPPLGERGLGAAPDRAVAFALWSAHLSEASFELPEVVLPHVFSRENNLEWAFERNQLLTPAGGRQLSTLATAVKSLPERWPGRRGDAENQLWQLLSLNDDDGEWVASAKEEVLDCRPPLHELSERSHGLVLLRWLLHRIMPYPCFLLDELQLSARLRVETLSDGGDGASRLLSELEPLEYHGTLHSFSGRRWWRAGIEDWIYGVTSGDAGNSRAVAAAAILMGAGTSREWLRPVISINGNLSRSTTFAEVEETVRIRPDDWPPYADDAFTLRTSAQTDQSLRSLVEPTDRYMLEDPIAMDGK